MDWHREATNRIRANTRNLFCTLVLTSSSCVLYAQCAENNYIHDGVPSALLDCQPFADLQRLSPDSMSPADKQLALDRHIDLQQAAAFFGFDVDAPGWTYEQALSPLLRHNVLLVFTNATPLSKASHFVAIMPSAREKRVQVVPAFAQGLRPYEPHWHTKSAYSVFNRLVTSERGAQPITVHSEWVDYAVLYLTLVGGMPSVPTESDSIKANWDLSVKRGTTPVILIAKHGAATIECSDLSNPARTTTWRLSFDNHGQITQVGRKEVAPGKVLYMQTDTASTGAMSSPRN